MWFPFVSQILQTVSIPVDIPECALVITSDIATTSNDYIICILFEAMHTTIRETIDDKTPFGDVCYVR